MSGEEYRDALERAFMTRACVKGLGEWRDADEEEASRLAEVVLASSPASPAPEHGSPEERATARDAVQPFIDEALWNGFGAARTVEAIEGAGFAIAWADSLTASPVLVPGLPRQRRIGGLDAPVPEGPEDAWADTREDLVEAAFGLICNVDGSAQGWTQSDEWVEAADRWCARYDRVIGREPFELPPHDPDLLAKAAMDRLEARGPTASLVPWAVTQNAVETVLDALMPAIEAASPAPVAPDRDEVAVEVRRRMYAVAATWRVSPPTPADARRSRERVATEELWRQVAEDVEAWADAPDHFVPDLADRITSTTGEASDADLA